MVSPVMVGAAEASPQPTNPVVDSIRTKRQSERSNTCPPPISIGLRSGRLKGIASTRRISN